MLYPQATNITELDEENDVGNEEENDIEEQYDDNSLFERSLAEDGDSDESIGLANEFLPSAMGFTCKMKLVEGDITVSVKSAWYERSENGVAENESMELNM